MLQKTLATFFQGMDKRFMFLVSAEVPSFFMFFFNRVRILAFPGWMLCSATAQMSR
jgi:hypothetical protein